MTLKFKIKFVAREPTPSFFRQQAAKRYFEVSRDDLSAAWISLLCQVLLLRPISAPVPIWFSTSAGIQLKK